MATQSGKSRDVGTGKTKTQMENIYCFKDKHGKTLELVHIVAVRYAWNSYVGTVQPTGLCATGARRWAFFSPHTIEPKATYQVLGHVNPEHPDFNQQVFDWYHSETGDCPIPITVYDNMDWDASKYSLTPKNIA